MTNLILLQQSEIYSLIDIVHFERHNLSTKQIECAITFLEAILNRIEEDVQSVNDSIAIDIHAVNANKIYRNKSAPKAPFSQKRQAYSL